MDEPRLIDAREFEPAYEVEAGPEFPADGDWSCPVFAFDRDGQVVEEFVSRWGAPLVLRVKASEEWIGRFPTGGLSGLSGVFACPSPEQLCVVVDGLRVVRADADGIRCVADTLDDTSVDVLVDPATGEPL